MTLALKQVAVAGRLKNVSLALHSGQVLAIVGPNGAGKSTLLTAMAGLECSAAPGEVLLDGTALSAMPPRERARKIGYLPQAAEVAWDLTVETLVRLGRLPHRTGPAKDAMEIDSALKQLGLTGLRNRPLNRLSGGERARALLARVLAGAPQWILADEPLASLDLAHQLALLACFRELATQGRGVVLVLHDLAQAMNHADRVIVMQSAAVVVDGHPGKVLTPELIEAVWGLRARWHGFEGARALSFDGKFEQRQEVWPPA